MAEVRVGSEIADFELPDQQGYPWCLSGQLEEGAAVLVFYRGDWCPYCNGQLASYARNAGQFERRGVQLAGISVDPPESGARMVGKLRLPFPLLSDPRGELIRRYGLWDDEDGVATPSVIVVDRSREVRYFYSGSDFADRPGDEEVFGALKGLDSGIRRLPSNPPEIRVAAPEARSESVRPDKPAMTMEQLIPYYRGVYFATVALKKRFGEKGRSGRNAVREVSSYQTMVQGFRRALEETRRLVEA
ncbi:MAG TPA: peroxiredoxin family protein [Rubrobacteraceae bacterium]|nr:peroxiredoxin family protein [Rubrobacteraceae bacterium]